MDLEESYLIEGIVAQSGVPNALTVILAIATLSGLELPHGELGTLVSGGIIPILNILVALKVALGSWAVILIFIRYYSNYNSFSRLGLLEKDLRSCLISWVWSL